MHMISVDRASIDVHFGALGNFSYHLSTAEGDIPNKHLIPVFGGPYQMIFAIPDCMTAMFVICHTPFYTILRLKARGLQIPYGGL
jgi:hypothetical protein